MLGSVGAAGGQPPAATRRVVLMALLDVKLIPENDLTPIVAQLR